MCQDVVDADTQQHNIRLEGCTISQVHGFRMSLWREQLGELNTLYEHPGALACVQHVRKLTQVTLRSTTDFFSLALNCSPCYVKQVVELDKSAWRSCITELLLQEVMVDSRKAPLRQ